MVDVLNKYNRLTYGPSNQPATNDAMEWSGSLWRPRSFTERAAKALTTKGDLLYANVTGTTARLPIGTTGQVLTESAGAPAWAAPVSGAWTFLQTLSGSAVSSVDSTATFAAGKNYFFRVRKFKPVGAGVGLLVRVKISGTWRTSSYRASETGSYGNSSTNSTGGIQIVSYNATGSAILGTVFGVFGQESSMYFGLLAVSKGERQGVGHQVAAHSGTYPGSTSTFSAIRFYSSSGNMDVIVDLYRIENA